MLLFPFANGRGRSNPADQAYHDSLSRPSYTWGVDQNPRDGVWLDIPNFSALFPVHAPHQLHELTIRRIEVLGARAWGLIAPLHFRGQMSQADKDPGCSVVSVRTFPSCSKVCLIGSLPLLAGPYDIRGKLGIYYEVNVRSMNGTIVVGTACKPHPAGLFPGCARLSAGLFLDDFTRYYENHDCDRYVPNLPRASVGDVIGCGYCFATGAIFFTHNGVRLPDAFLRAYCPREAYDVYAAIGVEGENSFKVNFGGEPFRWVEGNRLHWKVEGHVGVAPSNDAPPSYEAATAGRRWR